MKAKIVEIGTKINMLTLQTLFNKDNNGTTRRYCKVKCDCGNEKETRLDNFLNRLYSCGCHCKARPNITAENNGSFNGYGEIRGTFFYNLKTQAEKREIDFDLSIEYLWELYLQQNKKCALSKVDIYFGRIYFKHETSASLDRIDSSKGYVKGNVQWVHKLVNKMKMDISQKDFIEMCKLIAINS